MAEEVPLSDGFPSVAQSTLVDGQVHRSTGPWTPAVQALLRYLEDVGFEGAPRVVGFDEHGREVLTWVDGDAPQVPWPTWMQTDEALSALGPLLRRFHDVVEGFTPPAGATWRCWLGAPGGPIIRHGDLWPSNVVFRGGLPVALIDWEFAQPGTRLDDIASAVKHWVPLISDERARGDGWHLPIDRFRRLRDFVEAYGLDDESKRAVIPTLLRNIEFGYQSHKTWAEQGVPGFKEMWEQGSGAVMLADRAWLEGARAELDAFATPS